MNAFLNSRQLEAVKMIAIITMVIDHLYKVTFDMAAGLEFMTYIGRLAFPLFAFIIAYNYVFNSKQPLRYIKLLFIGGAISIVPWEWALSARHAEMEGVPPALNILFTLGLGLLVTYIADKYQKNKTVQNLTRLIFMGSIILLVAVFAEYGVGGVALVPLMVMWLRRGDAVGLVAVMGLIFLVNSGFMSFVGLLSLACVWLVKKYDLGLPRLPRWFYYSFYPVQFALLRVLGFVI